MPTRIEAAQPDLELPLAEDKICWVIVKAREFEAKDVLTDPGDSSNPTDDAMRGVLEDGGDPVAEELQRFIAALTDEERAALVAMAWLGRGDGGLEDWPDLLDTASREADRPAGPYLLGMPLLADHLEAALDSFGGSCAEVSFDHL
ncbi:MAG: DUF3775 domain-containing protein [Sneathiellaceae bacterium]